MSALRSAEQVAKALELAVSAHKGQVDKLGVPYIFHVIRVWQNVSQDFGMGNCQIVALLHDLVEDTPTTLDHIRGEFGDDVAEAVDAITKREGESHKDYMDRVMANSFARIVKREDAKDNLRRVDNIRDEETHARLTKKYKTTLAILDGVDCYQSP